MSNIRDVLLPGLPHDLIIEKYSAAPGNEILSGKFCTRIFVVSRCKCVRLVFPDRCRHATPSGLGRLWRPKDSHSRGNREVSLARGSAPLS